MDYLSRNLMTVGILVLAFASALGELSGLYPHAGGVQLAQWAIVAGAAGRALVLAAEQIAEALNPALDSGYELLAIDENDGEAEGG